MSKMLHSRSHHWRAYLEDCVLC